MTGAIHTPARAEEATVEVTIVRADGRVEQLGVVSYYHRNGLRRATWKLKHFCKRISKAWQAS